MTDTSSRDGVQKPGWPDLEGVGELDDPVNRHCVRRGYTSGATPACDTTFTEMYSYNAAGAVVKKRLRVTRTLPWPINSPVISNADLDAAYTYDNEGRVTATQYPSTWNGSAWVAGPNLGNTYDSMGRPQKVTDLTASSDIISNATYNPAGQLLTMSGNIGSGIK